MSQAPPEPPESEGPPEAPQSAGPPEPPESAAPPGSQPPPPPPPSAPPPNQGKPKLGDTVGLPYIEWTPMTVLLGVLTAVGIMIVGTIPIAIVDPDLDSIAAKDAAQLMVGLALFFGAFVFALASAGGKIKAAFVSLGFRGLAWRLLGLAALAWFAYLICALALAPLLSPEQEDVTKEIGGDDGGTIAMIAAGFLIIVMAPISEEVFFRGFMFAGLRRRLPLILSAVISAAVWGSLHLGAGNVGVVIQLSVFGVILAILYERSGSLWAPIIAHMLNNTIAFLYLVTN